MFRSIFVFRDILPEGTVYADSGKYSILKEQRNSIFCYNYFYECIFCKTFDAQRRKHGRTRKAVAETIRLCRERNVLKDYLEDKGQEVVDIMMALFDEDYIWESYWNYAEKELEEKVEKKVEKKIQKKIEKKTARDTASRMLKNGEPLEKVAQYVPGLSEEEIRILAEEILQPA